MGGMSQTRRDESKFLGDSERGILFISSAGSVGTNVAPGCWTVFVVGDLPYNNACLKQAVRACAAQPARGHQDSGHRLRAALLVDLGQDHSSTLTSATASSWPSTAATFPV